MSLRARLLVVLLALTAAGLLVLDLVSYAALRSYLIDRVDQQAQEAALPAAARLLAGTGGPFQLTVPPAGEGGPGEPPGLSTPPPGSYAELRTADGAVIASRFFPVDETGLPTPDLPDSIEPSGSLDPGSPMGTPFEVGPSSGSGSGFRVIALTVPENGDTLIVAVPLTEVDRTLDRLQRIELIVSLAVLAALAAAALVAIRIGLRPLARIEDTAGAIAAGDLSRRVEDTNERTEVGRLGIALNEMLGQIERAFAEREASEARLRQFLADASHELRTPLSSIRGYAELFRIGAAEDPGDLEKSMARIEAESERMGRLVDDLLALARLDEVREAVRERVDLTEVAHEVMGDALATERNRSIELAAPASAWTIGDPDQLRRLLSNLVANALRHTALGTPVEIGVGVDGDVARLTVRDHGAGLTPGTEAQVFDRFWRDDSGRSRDRGGTGLGLAIVAAIASAHGGRAEAANAADGGAVFTVTLPLGAQPPTEAPTGDA
jgi:two-component system OmpR family sensor kinase